MEVAILTLLVLIMLLGIANLYVLLSVPASIDKAKADLTDKLKKAVNSL